MSLMRIQQLARPRGVNGSAVGSEEECRPDITALFEMRDTLNGVSQALRSWRCAPSSTPGTPSPNCQHGEHAVAPLVNADAAVIEALACIDSMLQQHPTRCLTLASAPIFQSVNIFKPDCSLLRIYTRFHFWEVEIPVPFQSADPLRDPVILAKAEELCRAGGAPQDVIAAFTRKRAN